MVHGGVAGLKNGEPVMAGVLEEDHRDKMADKRLLLMLTALVA